ncbi:MAG: VUT family protein [Clostridia bacterium]|nr:VUT family protein [Clostridia bacterium]MBR5742603.1 VUT family protein [Clostridia bacterium]
MRKLFREFRDLLQSVPPLIVTFFVLSVVGMNLLANKSIETGVDWLALDCGILFSWLAFLSMDVITHVYGPRAATLVSFAALGMDLLMALIFFLASLVPGVWGESFVEGSEELINHALNKTFGGTWFVILGSGAAFIVSAVANNFLNAGVGKLLGKKDGFGRFALRAYVSTFLAQFLDNLVFAFLVSRTFFGWSAVQCLTCALTGAVTELLFEVVFSPFGYRVSKRIERTREAARAGEGG